MINIQDEAMKIHHQYGTSEMANYKLQLLVEQYAKEYHESEVKKLRLQNVNARTLGFASCAALAKSMPLDQAIQVIKSDITGLPQTAVIDGELVVQYVR